MKEESQNKNHASEFDIDKESDFNHKINTIITKSNFFWN